MEIERFVSFDHSTRRFIAYALTLQPEFAARISENQGIAGNPIVPFVVSSQEVAEREQAYTLLPRLRACQAKGDAGRHERRLHFADLLTVAKVDLRWKRLKSIAPFIFLYERIAGPSWRQLLPLCWKEAVLQRRKKGNTQLPLDPRLIDDASAPSLLEDDHPPWYYPSMADADMIAAPLLIGL